MEIHLGPLLDRSLSRKIGRRRLWALISQILLALLLLALAPLDPTHQLAPIALIAFLICFASATQDIVLDAYRRELLPDEELGLGNSLFVNAYRLSSLVPGSLPSSSPTACRGASALQSPPPSCLWGLAPRSGCQSQKPSKPRLFRGKP